MSSWQVQDAKSRFSELLNAALSQGPQIVTRRGVETAVVVLIEEWRRVQQASHMGLKDLLLLPRPRFEGLVRRRRSHKRRPLVEFE